MEFEELHELSAGSFRPSPQNRLTVVDKVYHLPRDGENFCAEVTFERDIVSDEQVYSRRKSVSEQWESLDFGWLDGNAGMLVIRNDEGRFLQRLPTIDERQAIKNHVLEISLDSGNIPHIVVPPGESCRFTPNHTLGLLIRCRLGKAAYTTFVFPR